GCQVGGCMTFDGVDDSVDISGTDFHALSTGTVVGWFFTETGGVLVGASSDSSTNRQFSIAPVATGIRVSAVNEAGVTQFACATTGVTTQIGVWHHFAYASEDGSNTFQMYFDGVPASISCSVGSMDDFFFGDAMMSGDGIQLGAKSDSDNLKGLFYGGRLDEIQIYPRVLSSQQIAQLYADGTNATATERGGPTEIVPEEHDLAEVWQLNAFEITSTGSIGPVLDIGSVTILAAGETVLDITTPV